jgi:hypothetical protein
MKRRKTRKLGQRELVVSSNSKVSAVLTRISRKKAMLGGDSGAGQGSGGQQKGKNKNAPP